MGHFLGVFSGYYPYLGVLEHILGVRLVSHTLVYVRYLL